MAQFLLLHELDTLSVEEYIRCHIQRMDVDRFEVHSGLNLMSFDLIDIKHIEKDTSSIIICQTSEELYFLCKDSDTLAYIKSLIKQETPCYRELIVFFQTLLKNDLDHMDDLEERITDMEDVLLKEKVADYTTGITEFRKELLRLRRYYEQLTQLFDGLIENDNGYVREEDIRFYKFLDQRSDRLLAHIVNLRDYITQVREAYQAQIDIEQNNIMRIFTVVTSIFLPLTLIVGWYGMNLQVPEFKWQYGYPFVVVLSLLVVIGLIFFFKKRKWF